MTPAPRERGPAARAIPSGERRCPAGRGPARSRFESDRHRAHALGVVPAQVQHDRREPRPKRERPPPLGVVPAQRAVGAHERVLRHLLGIAAVTERAEREAEEAVLVLADQRLERPVEVVDESRDKWIVHHSSEHPRGRACCIGRGSRGYRPRMQRSSRLRSAAGVAYQRLARVGADPRDDEDLRARKALLVLISLLILPISLLWGALYLAFGSPVGVVPLIYFAILLGAIVVFSRTRNFTQLLRVGQVDILLAPTLSMIPLGGFLGAGRRGPLGHPRAARRARVQRRPRRRPLVSPRSSSSSSARASPASCSARCRRRSPRGSRPRCSPSTSPSGARSSSCCWPCSPGSGAMRSPPSASEQAKAENLLLNILPRSIADRLKDDNQPIADQFGSASILFADVVDFTPWSERRSASRGGRLPRPSVQPLRRAGRAVRAREDQDDRRCLHGRRRGPDAAARPRPCPGRHGARHARGDARRATTWVTPGSSCASASTPGPSWPASSAGSGSCTTSGAMP